MNNEHYYFMEKGIQRRSLYYRVTLYIMSPPKCDQLVYGALHFYGNKYMQERGSLQNHTAQLMKTVVEPIWKYLRTTKQN